MFLYWSLVGFIAQVHNVVVVTEEVFNQDIKKEVPIPNACQQFNVPYLNTFQMPRQLGVRFDLCLLLFDNCHFRSPAAYAVDDFFARAACESPSLLCFSDARQWKVLPQLFWHPFRVQHHPQIQARCIHSRIPVFGRE